MRLLVIRHAIAEEREDFARTGEPDEKRPLTAEGKRKMRGAARGLRRLVPSIDVLAASPLVRAQQTAEIVAKEYDGLSIESVESLSPDSRPEDLARWLRGQSRDAVVAVVGHEPHLGLVSTWLMSGREESRIPYKKGGACLLEFDGAPKRGTASLLWLTTPGMLRALAE